MKMAFESRDMCRSIRRWPDVADEMIWKFYARRISTSIIHKSKLVHGKKKHSKGLSLFEDKWLAVSSVFMQALTPVLIVRLCLANSTLSSFLVEGVSACHSECVEICFFSLSRVGEGGLASPNNRSSGYMCGFFKKRKEPWG